MATPPSVDEKQRLQQQPLVWIVVLHYGKSEHTRACLGSLQTLTYANFKVLLVDNGSPDRGGQAVASEFPQFELLALPENQGFAGGCNAGARQAISSGTQWVWFLNNDATVEPTTLGTLIEQAQLDESAAALGAMVYTPHDGGFVPEGYGRIDFWRGKTVMKPRPNANQSAEPCDWLSGSNLLMRADAFSAVGGFDEKYYLYLEDVDLCYRIRQRGWRCVLVPKASIFHIGGGSTEGKLKIWRTYYYTRNRLLFFLSHSNFVHIFVMLVLIGGHHLRHLLVLPFRGENGRRQLKAELLGLRDFLLGRLGRARCLDW